MSSSTCPDGPTAMDNTETEQAFDSLLATLKRYNREYLRQGKEPSNMEVAEGYRYLLHLLSVGMELFVEGDILRPELIPIVSPRRKLMGDNADAYYYHASLSANGSYRVRGRNTGETYISLTLHTGEEAGGWATGVADILNSEEFDTDDAGNWEVLIGQDVRGPNTINLSPDTVSLISRHYYLNENYAAADPNIHPVISIERLDSVPDSSPPSDKGMAKKLRALVQFIRANSIERPLMGSKTTPAYFSLRPNSLGKPSVSVDSGWTAADNAKAAGTFILGPEEALIMKGRMPKCLFSNVVLWNKFLQSFDYRYRQVSLNKRQMELAEDGSFTIVIAHRDPGVANWLDTEGRRFGIVYWRFVLPTEQVEPIDTEVVPFSMVSSYT